MRGGLRIALCRGLKTGDNLLGCRRRMALSSRFNYVPYNNLTYQNGDSTPSTNTDVP